MNDTPPHDAPTAPDQECFRIGFVGHRNLTADEDYLKWRIAAELRRFGAGEKHDTTELPQPKIIAHSSIASGADTLFAETVIAHGIEWHVHLPFSAEEFRKDFSENDWARAEAAMAKATHIHTGGLPLVAETELSNPRAQAYSICAKRIADNSNVMIAIWDELPSRGPGGTGETVTYALEKDLMCFVINPAKLYSVLLRPESFYKIPPKMTF